MDCLSSKIYDSNSYAAGVAHDLGNLMTVVAGRLNDLKSRLRHDNQTLSQITELERIIEQSRDLTSSILEPADYYQENLQPVDLRELLLDCQDVVNAVSGSNVQTRVKAESGCYILGNKRSLRRLLLNVADNARKAMPDGGHFTITAKMDHEDTIPRSVQLVISDTGSGLSSSQKETLLTNSNITRQRTGSGMGLKLIRSIVNEHDAAVSVWSSSESGTRLVISFPSYDAFSTKVNSNNVSIPSGRPTTVLTVSRKRPIQDLLRDALVDAGHSTIETADTNVAIHALEDPTSAVDALLLDGDDFEDRTIIELACKNSRNIPFVVLTAPTSSIVSDLDSPLIVLSKPAPLGTITKTLTWLTASFRSEAA